MRMLKKKDALGELCDLVSKRDELQGRLEGLGAPGSYGVIGVLLHCFVELVFFPEGGLEQNPADVIGDLTRRIRRSPLWIDRKC
jgi:hypothetical protein